MPGYRLTAKEIPLSFDRMLMREADGSLEVMPLMYLAGDTLKPPQSKFAKPETYVIFLGDERAYQKTVLVGSPDREIGDVVQSVEEILHSKDGRLFNPLAGLLAVMRGECYGTQWGIYEVVPELSTTESRS